MPEERSASAFLGGYNRLPVELKDYIFQLACAFFVPLSSSSASHPLYDIPTCLSLSLVSKDLNERVQGALHRQVSITRPSALYALHQALEAHPERGKLIKNLHIGNQTALPADWWPLSEAYCDSEVDALEARGTNRQSYTWFACSLDRTQLPSGCVDRQAWALDKPPSGCRDAVILRALRAAQDSLGIDLLEEGRGDEPLMVRAIFEVQAALDLYLKRLRADEDANPDLIQLASRGSGVPPRCRKGECSHYPKLILTSVRTDQVVLAAAAGPCVLNRPVLLRHLARPGARTDRFDHPLTLSRSGYSVWVALPPGKGHPGYREGVAAEYELDEEEYYVDDTSWPDEWELRFEDLRITQSGSGSALNAALLNTATLGLAQNLVHAVWRRTPGIENLSLTGALQRSLRWSPLNQDRVRRATIGPEPPWWAQIVEPDIEGLKQIEELRIGGHSIHQPDMDLIATMRKLRKLEVSIGEPWRSRWYESVVVNVRNMINTPVPAAAVSQAGAQEEPGAAANDEAQELSSNGQASGQGTSPSPASPLTIVRLQTEDLDKVLASAPTPDVRKAWLHGRPVEGIPRRLKLVAKNIEYLGEGRRFDDWDLRWDVLYQEGRDWWLEGAV